VKCPLTGKPVQQDVDFESLEINLNHGVVHQIVGELKTEAS
jgi:hypothetical protein